MSTKKKIVVKKKVVAKKKTTAVARHKTEVVAVSSQGTDVFVTEPESVSVNPGEVLLMINNQNKGTVSYGDLALGPFAMERARNAGIKSFSLYADGRKVTGDMFEFPLTSVHKLEIVTKDTRG